MVTKESSKDNRTELKQNISVDTVDQGDDKYGQSVRWEYRGQ